MERQPEFDRDENSPRAMHLDSDTELRRALSTLRLSRTEREVMLFLSARQRAEGGVEVTVRRDELVAAAGCHSSTVSTACSRLQARGLMTVYRRGRGANSYEVNWLAVFDRDARPLPSRGRMESPAPRSSRRPDARQMQFAFVNDVACEVVWDQPWGVCVEVGCRVDEFVVASTGNNEPQQRTAPAPEIATSKHNNERQRTTSCPENATTNDNGATSSPLSPEVAAADSFLPSSDPLSSSHPAIQKSSFSSEGRGGEGGPLKGLNKGWLLKALGRESITVEELQDPARVDTLYESVSRVSRVIGLDGRRTQFHALAIRCLRIGDFPAGMFVARLERPDKFGKPWWLWAGEPGSVDWREAERRIARLGNVVAQDDRCGIAPRPPAPPAIARPVAAPLANVAASVSTRAFAEVDGDEFERRRDAALAATERLRRRWEKAGAAS